MFVKAIKLLVTFFKVSSDHFTATIFTVKGMRRQNDKVKWYVERLRSQILRGKEFSAL